MFKIGDKVLFSLGGESQPAIKSNFGIILGISDDKYSVVAPGFGHTSIYKNIGSHRIEYLDNKSIVENEILGYYNKEINKYKIMLKKITQETKDAEKMNKYESLKTQIKTTAKNLYQSKDDFDFENKLKAICHLKKQLYTIELDCISETRIYNGHIYHEIKQLEKNRDKALKDISDEVINKKLEKI